MEKSEFRALLEAALNRAAENAEVRLSKTIERSFSVELHGAGSSGEVVSPNEAAERLFIDNSHFYKIIDVCVQRLRPFNTEVLVRVSGHSPVAYEKTWAPTDLGPFKQILADHIDDGSDSSP